MSQRGSRRNKDCKLFLPTVWYNVLDYALATLTDSLLAEAPPGQTVAQYSTRRGRRNRSRRTKKGKKIATIDAAW